MKKIILALLFCMGSVRAGHFYNLSEKGKQKAVDCTKVIAGVAGLGYFGYRACTPQVNLMMIPFASSLGWVAGSLKFGKETTRNVMGGIGVLAAGTALYAHFNK